MKTSGWLYVMELHSGTRAQEWSLCAYVVQWWEWGKPWGLIVYGLVGPGTSHCSHNGAEQLILWWGFDK